MSWTHEFIEGDHVRNLATGRFSTVTNKAKAQQDTRMTLSTNIRRIGGQGSGLDDAVGRDQNNMASGKADLPAMLDFQLLVQTGLEKLRRAQRQNQFSQRTADELISDFTPPLFWPDLSDVRIMRWKVEVYTVSGRSNFPVSGQLRS